MPPKDKKALAMKEATILRRAIQSYDSGKYKASLKDAESILKKLPEHGETLAIKALCLAQLEKRKQAVDTAKKGLRQDLSSFLCWHALAICHKKDRNYEEALKCYIQAARLEPGNVNMYREIATMHVMNRQHGPVVEQRLKVLKMQPHIRLNWTQLAISHHLAGSLDEAARVLDSYEDTIKNRPEKSYEHSETVLYHASVLEEAGRYKEALDKLEQNSAQILDTKAADQLRAQCYMGLKNTEEAATIYFSLMEKNPNAESYLEGYLSAKGLPLLASRSSSKASESSVASKALVVFQTLEESFPHSTAVTRAALLRLHGEEFQKRARRYIVRSCQKGVPSLFSSMKTLYEDTEKCDIIQKIAESCRGEWEPKEESEEVEPPSTYLWCLYFLAQHYTFTGQHERALAYIDSAIAHTPTMPELHMTRARILKRAGDLLGAAHATQDARLLDGQDRYLNCKAAKYALRIDDVDGASATAGLFTKPDASSPVQDLIEMQAFWYLVEDAEAHYRRENWPLALKRLSQIQEIIDDMWHDQLDFHSYCIRKYTFRAYIRTVRWEDQIRRHPALVRAQLKTVELCCLMHDQPTLKQSKPVAGKEGPLAAVKDAQAHAHGQTNGVANGSPAVDGAADSSKKSNKAKKAEARAAAAEAARKAAAETEKKSKKEEEDEMAQPPKDEDPEGVKQLSELEPLHLASFICRSLQQNVPEKIETWLATFEWAMRERNWLSAVASLTHAHQIEATNPVLHAAVIRLKQTMPALDGAPEPVADSIKAALETVYPAGLSLEAFSAEYLQKHSESAPHVLGAARGLLALSEGESRRSEAAELVLRLPKLSGASLTALQDGQKLIIEVGNAELAREYNEAASQVWPRANAFKSLDALVEQAQDRDAARKRWEAAKDEEGSMANGAVHHTA